MMAAHSWQLLRADANYVCSDLTLSRGDLPQAAAGCSVRVSTLRGGLREGLQAVELDNGTCRIIVLPGRGMGVWKGWCGEDEIGWQSPVHGPVHPQYVPLAEPSGLGWLAGFDELLVRCGLESNGAPEFTEQGRLLYPLHGHIANLPAHEVELSVDAATGALKLVGVVDETRMNLRKLRLTSTLTMLPGQQGFDVVDEVTNLSGSPSEAQMLYHINFGRPACLPGSKLVLPIDEMCPRDETAAGSLDGWDSFGPADPAAAEHVYFNRLRADETNWSEAMVHNEAGDKGAGVACDTSTLPCFSVWKNTPAIEDGYVSGLEPGTNFPNTRTHEGAQGRVARLAAGESVQFQLRVKFHATAEQVATAQARIERLRGEQPAKIHSTPLPGWSV